MMMNIVAPEVNQLRTQLIEQLFGKSGQSLVKPGRDLICEGQVKKMCRRGPQVRHLFLFSDMLMYGKIIDVDKYRDQRIMLLEDVKVEDLPQTQFGWLIKSPLKSFAVYTNDQREKEEWMWQINKAIYQHLQVSGKMRSKQYAPEWIPDSSSDVCMRCDKTRFNQFIRRHHCRNCGFIVCGSCSKNQIDIKGQSIGEKKLRVCDRCFNQLRKSRISHSNICLPNGNDESICAEDVDLELRKQIDEVFETLVEQYQDNKERRKHF